MQPKTPDLPQAGVQRIAASRDQVAGHERDVGAGLVGHIDSPFQLLLAQERAQMDIRHLHKTQPVQIAGQTPHRHADLAEPEISAVQDSKRDHQRGGRQNRRTDGPERFAPVLAERHASQGGTEHRHPQGAQTGHQRNTLCPGNNGGREVQEDSGVKHQIAGGVGHQAGAGEHIEHRPRPPRLYQASSPQGQRQLRGDAGQQKNQIGKDMEAARHEGSDIGSGLARDVRQVGNLHAVCNPRMAPIRNRRAGWKPAPHSEPTHYPRSIVPFPPRTPGYNSGNVTGCGRVGRV
jgi:hypothetical protein